MTNQFSDDELRALGLDDTTLAGPPATTSPYGGLPDRPLAAPTPVPQRSVAKTAVGGALGVFALLMVLSLVLRVLTGHFHATGLGYLLGSLAMVGLPAWGSWKLLTAHDRELKAWEEQRRLEQRRHGYGA